MIKGIYKKLEKKEGEKEEKEEKARRTPVDISLSQPNTLTIPQTSRARRLVVHGGVAGQREAPLGLWGVAEDGVQNGDVGEIKRRKRALALGRDARARLRRTGPQIAPLALPRRASQRRLSSGGQALPACRQRRAVHKRIESGSRVSHHQRARSEWEAQA